MTPVYPTGVPVTENILHPEENMRKTMEEWDIPELGDVKEVARPIIQGTPFVEIVRYAREQSIDLIVMGTHGRSGLTHALLGNVSEKVVRKASCPVLTVRAEGHQFVMP